MKLNTTLKRVCLSLCLSFGICHGLFADFGQLRGRITDAQSGQGLIGAYISLDSLQKGALSDAMGYFVLHHLPAGEHDLFVSYLGYEKRSQTIFVKPNAEIAITIALEESALDLSTVTIAGQNGGSQLSQIQALDLRLRPIQSSQEALRAVPGLMIAQHAGGGKAEQIFLRGFDIDHGTDIQLSVDGMPVNMVSHAHGQGYADLHFLIPETIERISADKGPYDADKGNFATAGYVDFQTQSSLKDNLVKLEVGQFQRFRTLGMFNLLPASSQHNAYIATEYVQNQGYFESPQDFSRLNLMAKYTGQLSEQKRLSISLSHFQSSWDASGQIPERAVRQGLITRFGAIDDTEGGESSRQSLNVQLDSRLDDGSSFSHQFALIRYDFSLFSNFTFFLEDSINGDQIWQHESRDIVFAQSTYRKAFQWAGLEGLSEIGASLRADNIKDNELAHTANRTTLIESYAKGDIQENNLTLFARQQLQLSPNLNVEAGVRYDYFQFRYEDALEATYAANRLEGGVLSSKLKINYQLKSNFKVYLQAGSGFHSNDARSLQGQDISGMLPQASGADLGFVLKPSPRIYIQSALWFLHSEQEFVYVGDAGIVEASGQSMRRGVDLSTRLQLAKWLFAEGDFTYTYARFPFAEHGAQYVPLAPILTASGGLNVLTQNGFEGSLRARYLGDRPANEDYSLTADGYLLLDAVIRYSIGKISCSLTLENILNTEWKEAQFETTSRLANEPEAVSEIHYTPGTPFQGRLALEYRF
ncbi:MAG: TonB-dependent receptor [Bacteroidia bacterium]